MVKKFWKTFVTYLVTFVMTFSVVLSMSGCDLLGVFSSSIGDSSSTEPKETYTFVYDTNYEGGRDRTIEIAAGKMASQYNPTRTGYILDGWFYESDCKTPYDFATPVNQDTTIYALWTSENSIVYHEVTFDYGEGFEKVLSCRAGKEIASYTVMESQRLGYEIVGWYKDKGLTQEFVLNQDLVEGAMTLYAKYVQDEAIKYTEDGDFDFENVKISIGFNDGHSVQQQNWVKTVIEEFNQSHEGKIEVSIAKNSEAPSLVFNQTEMLNTKYSNYIPMTDALEMAGKSFTETQYYKDQINDCYINGKLYTMPIGSFVPVVVYNKSLMNKYNPNGDAIESHEDFMELLEKVEAGEGSKDSWQGTLTMSISWDMAEIASNNFYIQNNLPLYSLNENGKYSNQWLKDSATTERMLNATNDFRNMFVKEDAICKITGKIWTSGQEGVKWSYIGTGESFMGVMGTPNTNSICGYKNGQSGKTLFDKTVGAMPISYLFASQGDEASSDRIFVKNFSLAIPKYSKNDMEEVAAAAVFAEFMSKYCDRSAESYIYPANKLAQKNMFNNLRKHWSVDYLLAYCGNPENFYTYPGGAYEYNVINTVHSKFLTNALYWLDDDATDEQVMAEIVTLCTNINKEIGV